MLPPRQNFHFWHHSEMHIWEGVQLEVDFWSDIIFVTHLNRLVTIIRLLVVGQPAKKLVRPWGIWGCSNGPIFWSIPAGRYIDQPHSSHSLPPSPDHTKNENALFWGAILIQCPRPRPGVNSSVKWRMGRLGGERRRRAIISAEWCEVGQKKTKVL